MANTYLVIESHHAETVVYKEHDQLTGLFTGDRFLETAITFQKLEDDEQ